MDLSRHRGCNKHMLHILVPKVMSHAQGCWVRGLLLLCSSTLPPVAALGEWRLGADLWRNFAGAFLGEPSESWGSGETGAGCGVPDSFAPTGSARESGNFPWMVSLQGPDGGRLAFGAILSKHWIVTAASGIYDRGQVSAVVGVAGLKVAIGAIVPHEAFDDVVLAHNIALLKTAAPIHFSETVQPICFPAETFPVTALENCLVVGSLQPPEGEGDPGNPVVCQAEETGQWLLKGILTEGGARCYGPFLYTKVSCYSEWIVSTTAQWGDPISPISGRRRSAFQTPMEQRKGAAEPFLEQTALNSSDIQLGLNWTQEPREDSHELPEQPGEPRGRSDIVYYDYYGGELVPISTAVSGQPWRLQGLISASSLLLWLGGIRPGQGPA
uniref:Inactive serine protease 54 isoform X2 n=1 Tax=Pogona vitticeps TaxID=103695 RepID=A0ABM5EU18_9SAUR